MTLRAAVTSEEKSTCPGESIRLTRYLLEAPYPVASISNIIETPEDLMVIPCSFSSSIESSPQTVPAMSLEIYPDLAKKESEIVVLPWST